MLTSTDINYNHIINTLSTLWYFSELAGIDNKGLTSTHGHCKKLTCFQLAQIHSPLPNCKWLNDRTCFCWAQILTPLIQLAKLVIVVEFWAHVPRVGGSTTSIGRGICLFKKKPSSGYYISCSSSLSVI